MSYIVYKSDTELPGVVKIIGNTSTHNFGTGIVDDSLISRFPEDVWYTTITKEEAESVVWLWTKRDFRKVKLFDVPDSPGGTGSKVVERTAADQDNAVSLGKIIKKKIAADFHNKEFTAISAGESKADVALWKAQLDEAQRYSIDSTVSTPVLSLLSSNRDATVSSLAAKILVASDNYNLRVAGILNKQQIITDTINTATTIVELDNIDPEGLRTDL
jgi:hypothetical protein